MDASSLLERSVQVARNSHSFTGKFLARVLNNANGHTNGHANGKKTNGNPGGQSTQKCIAAGTAQMSAAASGKPGWRIASAMALFLALGAVLARAQSQRAAPPTPSPSRETEDPLAPLLQTG